MAGKQTLLQNMLIHVTNVSLVPCKSLFQEVWVQADLVHQCVEVSLHCQSLEDGSFGHRSGEEGEWTIGHHLKTSNVMILLLEER